MRIKSLLIANRGEIACRIARTARRMDVRTIAVFSEVDRTAAHIEACDSAVALGGQRADESYLRGDVIIEAALASGAEAIHPGYGFLSENAGFAQAVVDAGLIWVGPSAEAIAQMGDKARAKAVMAAAGVPVVRGYHGANQDAALLAREAAAIGFPVLIKAVAGGGGKGMRAVEEAGEFDAALASAQAEARASFGNADVLIEKLVQNPRHIEVQIFGDGKSAVHLYERDCSLQRRHQKVLEEAPAPSISAEFRTAVSEAAVQAAKAIAYSGAGTVEFIADASNGLDPDQVYFMEMNTRLQVEHPVSEAVTGIDLVEWQLRVAGGEALPLAQSDIPLNGHAIEARLYAEDVAAGFLPAVGTLHHLRFPKEAEIHSGVREGDTVSPFYDPMIAKLVTHAPTREAALVAMSKALAQLEVGGVVTNQGFLSALIADEDVRSGAVDTSLIARKGAALTDPGAPDASQWCAAALAALGLRSEDKAARGYAHFSPLRWAQTLTWGDLRAQMWLSFEGADVLVELEGQSHRITGGATWRLNGDPLPKAFARKGEVDVFGPVPLVFGVPDPLESRVQDAGGNVVRAPMPGLMTSVSVTKGASVVSGQALAKMEAMKMEHTLTAPRAGVVSEVLCVSGAQVGAGDTLIRLEMLDD